MAYQHNDGRHCDREPQRLPLRLCILYCCRSRRNSLHLTHCSYVLGLVAPRSTVLILTFGDREGACESILADSDALLKRMSTDVFQAFDSPLLADEHSNSSGRDMAKTDRIGGAKVRYGATTQYGRSDQRKLAFANPVLVSEPQKGMRFDL